MSRTLITIAIINIIIFSTIIFMRYFISNDKPINPLNVPYNRNIDQINEANNILQVKIQELEIQMNSLLAESNQQLILLQALQVQLIELINSKNPIINPSNPLSEDSEMVLLSNCYLTIKSYLQLNMTLQDFEDNPQNYNGTSTFYIGIKSIINNYLLDSGLNLNNFISKYSSVVTSTIIEFRQDLQDIYDFYISNSLTVVYDFGSFYTNIMNYSS